MLAAELILDLNHYFWIRNFACGKIGLPRIARIYTDEYNLGSMFLWICILSVEICAIRGKKLFPKGIKQFHRKYR